MTVAALRPALELATRPWPVLPIHPAGKTPLTRHGVKDATTDPAQIRRWFTRWPQANLAVATGHPGPQVLDVDQLERVPPGLLAQLDRSGAPVVATTRGRHYYLAGQNHGTVAVDYGELRGLGSYVVCPPSVHPSGKEYVWLYGPAGPLPAVPAALRSAFAERGTAGAGEHQAPDGLVPHGQRHGYLKDFAVRLTRAGITDQRWLLEHLRCEFRFSCEPLPAPAPGALEALASWAARSDIAGRERRAINDGPLLRPQPQRSC